VIILICNKSLRQFQQQAPQVKKRNTGEWCTWAGTRWLNQSL